MNWLLIVVLLLIVFRVYRGYKKGAIHMILSFSALIISVLLTGFLGPVVSRQLCESEIVLGYVSDAVNESLGIEDAMLETKNQIARAVTGQKIDQSQQQEAINKIGLPSSINDTIMSGLHDTISNTGTITAHKFAVSISDELAKIIIRGITYVVIFLIAKIGLRIIIMLFGIIDKLPRVEDASQLAGAGIGAISGFIMVWVGFLFLLALSSTNFGIECYRCINESTFLTFLYNNNLLLKWILYSVNG